MRGRSPVLSGVGILDDQWCRVVDPGGMGLGPGERLLGLGRVADDGWRAQQLADDARGAMWVLRDGPPPLGGSAGVVAAKKAHDRPPYARMFVDRKGERPCPRWPLIAVEHWKPGQS